MATNKVFLVPGFFGFTSLGALSYFHRVGETLRKALRDRGVEAEVVECPTEPSGSITRRSERLLDHVVASGGLDAEEIHFVGHSTGGLDVRLLLSPTVRVAGDSAQEAIGERCRSAVAISTPHYGSPLATYFASVPGKKLLEQIAKNAASTGGRAAIVSAARGLSLVAKADNFVRRTNTALDDLSNDLLRGLSMHKDDPVWAFLRGISQDQGIIVQLTPESMALFNALSIDRPTVSYSCIATAAPKPPYAFDRQDLFSPWKLSLAVVFTLLHRVNAKGHPQYPYPEPDPAQRRMLREKLPDTIVIDDTTSDGIVPTLSQLRGTLLHAVEADHLDVVGQYRRYEEPLSDWLPSGAKFDRIRFDELWGIVAAEIVRAR